MGAMGTVPPISPPMEMIKAGVGVQDLKRVLLWELGFKAF